MSASRAKKVKMATKSCPECDQQVGGGPAGGRPLPAAVGCGEAPSPGPGGRAVGRPLGSAATGHPDRRLSPGCPGRRPPGGGEAALRRAARKGAWAGARYPGGSGDSGGSAPRSPSCPDGKARVPPGAGSWRRAPRPARGAALFPSHGSGDPPVRAAPRADAHT